MILRTTGKGNMLYILASLVGRLVFHRFDVEGEEKWYTGHDMTAYMDEEDNCF